MGYRSDVVILIYGETDDITAFVAGEKLHGKPKGIDFHPLDEEENESHERHVYSYKENDTHTMMEFSWYDVKWYDSYPDVKWWENLSSIFEEAFPRLCMEVAIVGESLDDNRTDYYGDSPEYYLNISRAIERNMP